MAIECYAAYEIGGILNRSFLTNYAGVFKSLVLFLHCAGTFEYTWR
jgi:hypothetical protein